MSRVLHEDLIRNVNGFNLDLCTKYTFATQFWGESRIRECWRAVLLYLYVECARSTDGLPAEAGLLIIQTAKRGSRMLRSRFSCLCVVSGAEINIFEGEYQTRCRRVDVLIAS